MDNLNGTGKAPLPRPSVPVPTPIPLNAPAFRGITGDIVRHIAPLTEACPESLLVTLLTGLGNILGDLPYIDRQTHLRTNLFAALVGRTSRARKGTSWNVLRSLLEYIDPLWYETRRASGLISGEGLISMISDPVFKDGELIHEGSKDKRLFFLEEEFATILRKMQNPTSILSPLLRKAWLAGELHYNTMHTSRMTKRSMVSFLGHVTDQDLVKYLDGVDVANGFAPRFLYVHVYRNGRIPLPKTVDLSQYQGDLQRIITAESNREEIKSTQAFDDYWNDVYDKLTPDLPPSVFADITSRAEGHVTKLALVYAILDQSGKVDVSHLESAICLWNYCSDSARWIFARRSSNPNAEKIITYLRIEHQATLTDLYKIHNGNMSKRELDEALDHLENHEQIKREQVASGGRGRSSTVISLIVEADQQESELETVASDTGVNDEDLPF